MSSILILGGGLAGLFAALKLSPNPVTVLTPVPLGQGASSAWAQGGIAAAIGEGDSIESHVADTLAAGAGLCDEAMVRLMASEASDRIHDLLEFGVPFDRDLAGKLVQSREAAHSAHRIVRVKGDMAGAKIMEALIAAVRRTPSIRVIEGAEAIGLDDDDCGNIAGAYAMIGGRRAFCRASHVVLATGGLGHLYQVTTNPKEAWGSGLAMAYRAGATLANMEFVQFHPTAIDIGRDPAPLATEALRGEGATLVDRDGRRFMLDLHKDAELAPRDVVARGVFQAIQAGRGAFLDCRTAIGKHFAEAFPTVHASCKAAGIDPAVDLIPVAPAAHYHMGGVWTDQDGRARGAMVPANLFAIGEVACTGVHGANRLASNSLLEAVVFGARAAAAIGREGGFEACRIIETPDHPEFLARSESAEEAAQIKAIRRIMQGKIGVLRTAIGLHQAWKELDAIVAGKSCSRRVMAMQELAEIICTQAQSRYESRGGHARADCQLPYKLPLWSYHTGERGGPHGLGPIPNGVAKG